MPDCAIDGTQVSGSLESDLGEAPELARVQPFPLLCLEMLERLKANLEVLTHALTVEFVGHSGKLDFAVQWLVRNAQQCAVGHPKAEAVRRNGGRLHVERDGARLRQSPDNGQMIAELPIAVVDTGHRSGSHDLLQIEAGEPRHLANRLLGRHLHLGKRRNGNPSRQLIVEYVVLANVTMRKHVVAELLRVAQARAVAEHQPCVRPQHRDMVGDVAGIRRAGADIDNGDTAAVRLDQPRITREWVVVVIRTKG